MNWYLAALKKYAVFSGRETKKAYWMFILFNAIFFIVVMILEIILVNTFNRFSFLTTLYALAVCVPLLAATVRRLHDIGKSGWWIFISLIPIVGSIWLLVLLATDSQPGTDQYGLNPDTAFSAAKSSQELIQSTNSPLPSPFPPTSTTPTNIHVSLAIEKGGKTVAMLAIPRDAVEHPSETSQDELKKYINGISARCVKEKVMIWIALTISDYNNDPRELFEIPEVCRWARDTFNQLPGLWQFLDKASRDFFVVWLCGPLSHKETELPNFKTQLVSKTMTCSVEASNAFSEMLREAGASEELIKGFYSQMAQDSMERIFAKR